MSTKFLKKGLFPRLTIFFIIASFIISGNAVKSFAGTGNLRPKANRKSSRASELRSSLDVVSIGKGFSKIDKAGSKDGGNVEQAKGQDPFHKILGDYSVSQSIDDLPYGTYIKNEIDLAKSSPATKTNLEMNFGALQDTDRFYTLTIKGTPLALVKKDKEGLLLVKKISDTFSAIPMKALTEMPSQFTSQGLDAADVLINDFIFFEKRASVPIPERMTIEFRELLNYVYELAKEVGEKKALEMGAALIDTTPDKLASIFRKLGREDAKVKGLELAGGKGLSLSVMAKIVAVPAGLNVTTTAYFKFVRENRKVWEKIFNELRVLDTMDDQRRDTVTEEIRKVMKEAAIPEDIKHEIVAMYRQLNVLAFLSGKATPTPVAVRSSGTKEDIHITTFLPVSTGSQAGQSDTFLNVRGESKVLEKTRADFSSLFTDRAVSYRDDATFLLWSGSITFKGRTSQTVYFDIVAKLREYATKLSKPEYKLYADSMSKVTSPNPGSVNLMNALEDILQQEDNPEIANALKMLREKSQEVVHPEQIGIDVVIMQMVKSHFAGVIFTVNPATKMAGVAQALYKAWFENDDSLVYRDAKTGKITGTKPIVVSFDIAFGYGENVVGGKVNPDKFIMSTYNGEKWIVLEKNKGNKLIQMIDVEEAIKYLGDEIPQDKALEIFAKVKKDALIYLQKWMKEGDIRVTTQEGDPLAYEAIVAMLEAPDAMLDFKKELVIRWLGKTVGEAISYDEVGKAINGILAKDLQGIKYLQPDPKKTDEKDKDKKERLQKLANDIAGKVKDKESQAEVIKFIKDNFYVSSQKGEKGVQENILPQATSKIFVRVQEAAQETERGMRNLAAVLGDLKEADSLRWTVKEIWENKEYRKPQERQEVLARLGLSADKQKNLSYLLRSLIDNSLTANYETTPEHQNEFTITDQVAERICRMAWSIANFYKDKRDIEFAIEADPTVSSEERIELFLRDKFGKLWGTDENGKAVMVTEANMATTQKASMKLYNVQARPYTADYLKVDVVRARTEVDEKYLEEKNPKPIASGTKGENATHAYVIVYDPNKGVPWHADLIRRLQAGIFTDEEKEQIRKAGLNPDDYGEGKDQRLPIALNLLEADPNHDPIMRLVAAVVTTRGGDTCHAAIFCREQGIPAVTGTGKVILKDRLIQTGDFLTVDANNGKIYEMDPDPAKRIPIIFVKFKIKPYVIPGDDDGMEFPKIGQIIAATSAAQQNSPIMLAVDADGNSLTRAEFKGEEIGVNVFAGYGHYLIQEIKAGKMKKPSRIYAADLVGAKLEGSADFYMVLSSEIYKYLAGHPSAWKAFVDIFGHEPGVEDSIALLTAYDLKRDLDLSQTESERLTPGQARAISFTKKLNQADQDFFEYTYGVFQRRYNYDYNIITDLENHPWILQEVDNKLKEKGYKTFSEYVRNEFIYFYNLMGFTIAPTQTAKNRAYDFAQDKVRGMPGSEVFSWPGVNPLVGLRGSALEIEAVGDDFSGNQLVLDFLFDSVIESNENTHNQAWFYVFVRSTREVDVLDKIIERKAKEKGKLPKQIGIMIEVPSDAMLAGKLAAKLKGMEEKYKKYGVQYTFFSFGTNDYSHLAGKGDREDPRMKLEILDPAAKQAIEEMKKAGFYYDDANKKLPLIDEGADVMIQLMEAVVKHADDARVVTSLCGEAITALVNRGAYEIAGRIMSLLKSFGVSMMKVRLAASMTRYDTMAATKEITVREAERKILFDLSSGEVRQKSGVIKGEVIYIEKAEDLLPESLKGLRGEELKKKREELAQQSLASAQSTVRTYNKIVVIGRNFASQEKEGLVAALGQDLFARLTKEGMLKEIASDIYIWTNLDLDAEKLAKELAKLGLSEAETKTATIAWKESWDNSIDGLERLGIDWDDLQYAKAIIVDASVNLEGWNVFRKDKSINAARIKAVAKGIGVLRHELEGKTVTIDYGAKKIYEGNLAVRKIKSELRDLPIPKVRPEVPVANAVAVDANNVYSSMKYHPLVILAYERGELDSLAKIFDEYASKLAEEVEKVTQEGNEAKRIWLLNNLRQKVEGLTDPLVKDFMTNLIDQVLKGKTITLKKGWVDELRAEYFTGLKTGIKQLLGAKTAEQFISDAFKQQMLDALAQNPNALVVYKPTSLNCVQLNNMEAGFLKEQVNPNPDYGLLGAARAIGDMWEINRMGLKSFKEVSESLTPGARKNFALQITELRGTQSGAVVIGWKYILKDMDIIPGRDGLMVGVNIVTPSDTLAVDKYFEYFNDLGTGLSFVSGDIFKIGAAWAGVDIYWNEWRRLAREEELLELGETASLIVAGKIDKWNKDHKNTPKKIVVFSDEGDNNLGNNAVPAFADAATTTLPVTSVQMGPPAVTAAPLMLMDGGLDEGRQAAQLLGVQPPQGIPFHHLISRVGQALTDTPEFKPRAFRLGKYEGIDSFFFQDQDNQEIAVVCVWDKDGTIQFNIDKNEKLLENLIVQMWQAGFLPQTPSRFEDSIKIEFSKKDGGEINTPATIDEIAKSIEPALRSAAKQRMDALVAGGMDRERATIYAFNLVSQQYSPEMKVEPGVIALAKGMALKLTQEQDISPSAALFNSLVSLQAREIAASGKMPVHPALQNVLDGGAIAGKAAVAALDGGRQVLSMDKLGQTMQEENIDALLMIFDLNVKVKGTKVEDDERIVNIVPTVKKAYNELPAQDMYILTSKGRPDGKVVAEESLDPVYDHMEKLFAEAGITDAIYTRLPYDLSEAARIRAQISVANPDKIRVFEFMNTRYYPQEESADIEARKLWQDQIFAVMGKSPEKVAVIGDYFDKIQRGEHASVEIVKRIPQILRAGGLDLQEKIDKAMLFKDRAKGVFFAIAGGKKFDKYKQLGLLAKKAQVTGGRLAIIGALADPYLKSMGLEIGKSLMPKDSEMKDVTKGLEKITKSKVEVMYPLDFVAEGQVEPKETLASDMLQIDIGPKTIKQMVDYIQKLQPGDGLVLNGGAGIFERKEASEGTIQLLMAASEAADQAVAVALAGGDMVKAAKELKPQVEARLGKPMSDKLIIISGGGALLEVLAKEIDELPAADALLEPEVAATETAADGGRAIVTDMARNLGVKEAELMNFVKNEVEAFMAMQGSYDFGLLVARMDSVSQAAELSKDQHPTLIMSSNLFNRAATVLFINQLLVADELRLVIYGKNADQLKILLNNQNIITAGDLAAAREEISGFDRRHTVLLVTEEDNQKEISKYGSDLLKVSVPKDMPVNLALAKAVEGAVNNKQATEVLADYLAGLENSVIVEQPAQSRQAMLAELEQGIPFEFPGALKATDQVTQLVEKTEQERVSFMNRL
jgi:phosphoenolpyruvate synthase/pyruvate phosphate dikinase/3-phosphoglycerate kinase